VHPEGSIEFKCDRCSNLLSYSGATIDLEAFSGSERGMGPETGYKGDNTYECPICENDIYVEHEVWEYPIGAFNNSKTEVMGASLITDFGAVNFSYDDEIYSFNEKSQLFVPEQKKIITGIESGILLLLNEIESSPNIVFSIKSREFEELIAYVFKKEGFEVQLTKQTRDGGRDIIALKNDLGIPLKFIIECKRWANDRPVSVDIVRALYGVQMQEGANKSVVATTSYFSPDAKKFAASINTTKWHMSLKDHQDVMEWLLNANKS
jgi:hypothetical protein